MADWGLLAGLGSGLSALGDGIDQYQMRKLAEEEQKLARQRQAEQDALQKAQLGSNEFRQMDALNFRPASNTDILNNVALKRGQTEFKSDVSGQTFLRDPGMSPTDLRQQNEQDKRDSAMALVQEREARRAEIAALKEGGLNQRWQAPSGNVQIQEQGRNDRWDRASGNVIEQQRGANFRDVNGGGSTGTPGKKTEAQAKAETFSGLMQAAEAEIAKNPWGSKPLSAPVEIALKGDGKGFVGNAVAALARGRMSPEQQRAVQSRTQFTQAALYAFSGQAAPDNEVAKNIAIFFPQSGETDPAVIEQKARMRATATMLLEKRKAGFVEGAVPLAPDAVIGGGSALSRLNGIGR